MKAARTVVSTLLVASAVNLTLMVPGGFVETRDFSAYPATVLGAFNVFLTVLGLGSFFLAYRVAKAGRGYGWAALAGFAYVAVYLLDLGRIFPVPPNPMSMLLATLEWIGTALGTALAAAALMLRETEGAEPAVRTRLPMPALLALSALAVVIVAFATWSAMGL